MAVHFQNGILIDGYLDGEDLTKAFEIAKKHRVTYLSFDSSEQGAGTTAILRARNGREIERFTRAPSCYLL